MHLSAFACFALPLLICVLICVPRRDFALRYLCLTVLSFSLFRAYVSECFVLPLPCFAFPALLLCLLCFAFTPLMLCFCSSAAMVSLLLLCVCCALSSLGGQISGQSRPRPQEAFYPKSPRDSFPPSWVIFSPLPGFFVTPTQSSLTLGRSAVGRGGLGQK